MALGGLLLTPKGQRKIQAALQAAAQAAQIGVAREVQGLRAEAARRAPSSEDEARLLSRGVAQGNMGGLGFGLGIFGTPEGGRFLRQGGQVSLREAIVTEPIQTQRKFDRIVAGIGSPGRINARTGFYWATGRRGIQGPTEPFNRAYLQAVENGGLVWTVRPRPDNRRGLLEPEPGRLTRQMLKTIPPFRMYSGAFGNRKAGIKERLIQAIRTEVRRGSKV
jgi:hypothetical protein